MKTKLLSVFAIAIIPISVFASYGIQTKTSGCIANQALPDSSCTPGAVFNVSTATVCTVGYTTKVRDVPLSEKKQVFKEYGISYSLHANYEVDHLISLEVGGSNDISNLWPESYVIGNGSHTKDGFENYLHSQVCKGNISLAEAQSEIATDWFKYYDTWKGIASATTKAIPQARVVIPKIYQPAANTKASVPAIIPSLSSAPVIPATQSPASTNNTSEPAVKESTSGICHLQGDPYYARTIHFTSFNSIADCLASGGRASK